MENDSKDEISAKAAAESSKKPIVLLKSNKLFGSTQSVNAGTKNEPGSKRNSGQFDGNPLKTNTGENPVPRRLSQLFTPPSEEELTKELDQSNECTRLLGEDAIPEPNKKPQIVPKSPKKKELPIDNNDLEDRLTTTLVHIENEKIISSDLGSSGQSSDHNSAESSSNSTDGNEESFGNKGDDGTSWDDTICSNRSTYFKHYYQKYSSSLVPTRQFATASPHTSLVSLIKEKNKVVATTKEDDKKKKRENIGLMALVIFLFLVLVIGISLIYHFYNIHLEELSLFKKLKFHEEARLLDLYDSNGKLDIQARLGTTLSPYSKPEDCTNYLHYLQNAEREKNEKLDKMMYNNQSATDYIFHSNYNDRPAMEFQFDEETVCLDWSNQARIQIHRAPKSVEFVNCYNVYWSSQNAGMELQDCVQIASPEFGAWYGIGDITGGGFPLESRNIESYPLNTGQLGKDRWGRVLRRTFVSSDGGLLMLPNHLPASVSISSQEICIAVNVSNLIDKISPLTLNYTVCASPNITSIMEYFRHFAGVIPTSSNDGGSKINNSNVSTSNDDVDSIDHYDFLKDRILERIENPVWIPDDPKINSESILSFADQILATNESFWGHNLSSSTWPEESFRGHILLPPTWQKRSGNFEFDAKRFPDYDELAGKLRLKGFRLALTISPLVAIDASTFKNGTREGLFVQQMGSNLPALISYGPVFAGALTDFTNARACEWFAGKLDGVESNYGIDRFHLDPPDSKSIPTYHEFNQRIPNPDIALQPFLKAVARVSVPMSTDSSLGPPPIPTFVTVGTQESGWESLSSLIPRMLTLTMLGFPLIDAGIIGGNPGRPGNIPDDELFIRWSQVAAFLPVFRVGTLPNMYESLARSIFSEYMRKRIEYVIPRLNAAINATIFNNSALLSPLALLYPNDLEAISIGDEWIIGDDLLVAPVLEKGKTSRDIYIPEGLWESQLDLRLKRGPGWVYDYSVPLTDLAYFIKRDFWALSPSR